VSSEEKAIEIGRLIDSGLLTGTGLTFATAPDAYEQIHALQRRVTDLDLRIIRLEGIIARAMAGSGDE
jgi:hypothetical protein